MKEEKGTPQDIQLVEELHKRIIDIKKEVGKVIIGQEDVIKKLLVGLFSGGHCLLVGVPGLAKTLLVKSLASALELKFNRIQFTPDLMPGDITGTEIIEEDPLSKQRTFRFVQGPLFTNILLADEINRTPPKTQAALLEAMQEHRITASGVTHKLDEPFFVLATQNPIEHEGTYPLPEAQLDRFMFNLTVEYPSTDEEIEIIKSTTTEITEKIVPVIDQNRIIEFQKLVRRVPVADNVISYTVNLVSNTRPGESNKNEFINEWVSWGAGPRASQFLILAAKCKAVFEGRFTPNINDVNEFLVPVLKHRVIPNFNAEAEDITPVDIINKLIENNN